MATADPRLRHEAGTVSEIPFTPSLSGARHGARRAVALGIAGARDAAAPSPSVISAAFGPACSPSRAPPLASTCGGRCLPVPPGATPRSPVALRGCLLVCGRWRAVGQPIIALPADWRAWSKSVLALRCMLGVCQNACLASSLFSSGTS
uniref:Uncharacterized protein n=1 Tax=Setaria viridis TaxID=4556 RepID=A0A4U6TP34_SETVI|nr:hypothetical protein SEVIR_8G261400v2 [Setaria viridis]